MESDTLFRYIMGYGLAIFSAVLIIAIVGRVIYLFVQNVFHISINFISSMKKIPFLLKSIWIKIKDYVIIICCLCVFVAFISLMVYDCSNHSDDKYYSPEEYEDALQDGKWNIPSRYRE